jgi:hypothetical protein
VQTSRRYPSRLRSLYPWAPVRAPGGTGFTFSPGRGPEVCTTTAAYEDALRHSRTGRRRHLPGPVPKLHPIATKLQPIHNRGAPPDRECWLHGGT